MKVKFLMVLVVFLVLIMPVNALSLSDIDENHFSLDDYDKKELADLFNTTTKTVDEFNETDINKDGNITIDEFEELIFIIDEDSFWAGYSPEEMIISEFEKYDLNHNDVISFHEFSLI
ncbi:EF-hand domain-containing protein [Methanobrevibacter woesei]|uniref:EF-hand domain-containing protein n=1 Tax=Methanobrevibacter woesei TaxID=190976 RepID=UPI0026DF5661|nr:EF-hand domain-containing protein [Methanobrevibacter woesei]